VLGETHGQRIDTMISDVVRVSAGSAEIRMSAPVWEATDLLRTFLFERVYLSEPAMEEERRIARMIEALVALCTADPARMPAEYGAICEREGTARGVCDFVACMTDRYAMRCYENWILPRSFANR
jgi:dGTPase